MIPCLDLGFFSILSPPEKKVPFMRNYTLSVLITLFAFVGTLRSQNTCIEIESILVDACAPTIAIQTPNPFWPLFGPQYNVTNQDQEGKNEMIRFRIGSEPKNISNLSVSWAGPNMQWLGLKGPDNVTAQKTAELNATIQSCGWLVEPLDGILPANSLVLLITSHEVSAVSNSFAQLVDTLYVIYQNNTSEVAGHFRNSSPDIQTTTISFGAGCQDQVTYRASRLTKPNGQTGSADGATVIFTPDGTPTYINNGCVAPVPIVSADWVTPGTVPDTNNILDLNRFVVGTPGGTWSGPGVNPDGTFNLAPNCGETVQVTYTVSLDLCNQVISDTKTFNITVNPNTSAAFSAPQQLCASNEINLSSWVTGTAGGTWTGQGVDENGIFNPEGLSGDVSLTYTVTSGVCPQTMTRSVSILPTPNAAWTNPGIICTESEPVDLSAFLTGTTGGTWSGQGISGSTLDPTGINGSVTVSYVVGNGLCADTVTHSIEVRDLPALSITGEAGYCENQNPNTLETNSLPGVQVRWYSDENLSVLVHEGSSYQPEQGTEPTLYVVQAAGTCVSEPSSVSVSKLPVPLSPEGESLVRYCSDAAVPTLTVAAEGGIEWYANADLDGSIAAGAQYTPEKEQTELWVTTTSENGCTSSPLHITIVEEQPVNAEITVGGDLILCAGETVILSSNYSEGNAWSTEQGSQSIEVEQPGLYTLNVTGYCNVSTAEIEILDGNPTADFSVTPQTAYIPFSVTVADNSLNSVSHTWYLDDVEIDSPVDQSLEFTTEGTYVIRLVVESQNGCLAEISKEIVAEDSKVVLEVPNSFTPNGDGFNDYLKISAKGVTEFEALIFNRWGQKVHQWKDPQMGWDAADMPDGVYYYVVKAKEEKTGASIERKGDITIRRK